MINLNEGKTDEEIMKEKEEAREMFRLFLKVLVPTMRNLSVGIGFNTKTENLVLMYTENNRMAEVNLEELNLSAFGEDSEDDEKQETK